MKLNDNISNLANLEFLVNYNDGQSKDEIESELFRVFFQVQGTIPYDRQNGGNFQNLEQSKNNEEMQIQIAKDMVLSVYLLNQSKNNNPYIVMGFSDVKVKRTSEDFIITAFWRKFQDLSIVGAIGTTLQ